VITNASTIVFDTYNPSLRWAFQPVIDHAIIHGRPIDIWASGKWNRIPIMTGHATNEGTYYVPSSCATSEEFTSFWHTLLPHYSESDLATLNGLYPDPAIDATSVYTESRDMAALGIGPQYKRVEAAYAQYAYICPVRQTADIISSFVSTHNLNPPVFVFHWALNKTVKGGANHGDNMYYESFPDDITSISESQKEVSGVYHAFITSFIVTGDPNMIRGTWSERVRWEEYMSGKIGGGEVVMTFGMGNDERAGGTGKGIAAQMRNSEWVTKECDFWWEKSHDTEE
jgi:acetylcholinesterase